MQDQFIVGEGPLQFPHIFLLLFSNLFFISPAMKCRTCFPWFLASTTDVTNHTFNFPNVSAPPLNNLFPWNPTSTSTVSKDVLNPQSTTVSRRGRYFYPQFKGRQIEVLKLLPQHHHTTSITLKVRMKARILCLQQPCIYFHASLSFKRLDIIIKLTTNMIKASSSVKVLWNAIYRVLSSKSTFSFFLLFFFFSFLCSIPLFPAFFEKL